MYRHRTFTRLLAGLTIASGFALAQSAAPENNQKQIDQLRRQLDRLVVKQKADEVAAHASNASVTADSHGFTIKSNDGDFLLNLGADLQVDNRSFFGMQSQASTDPILLRRARPVLQGTIYRYIDYVFRPDFGQGSVIIYDAYAELKYWGHARLRAGKFKPPVGLERLQSDDDTTFVERGLPSDLAPQRDIGFQLSGDIVNRRAGYAAGVFNGVPDAGLGDNAVSRHRDFAGRIFLTPFLPNEKNPLRRLGFGIGLSGGNVDGEALPSYKTFGQNNFISFAPGVTEAGHRTRLAPQLYYYLGGFGLLAEYDRNQEGLQKGAFRATVAFQAWQVETSYVLTGEKKGFTGVTPRRLFDPKNGGWGALEVAFRIGGFAAGRAFLDDEFASPANGAQGAREKVAGVNWYLNRLFRISADYGDTGFSGGNKPRERVVTMRFQLNFAGS